MTNLSDLFRINGSLGDLRDSGISFHTMAFLEMYFVWGANKAKASLPFNFGNENNISKEIEKVA